MAMSRTGEGSRCRVAICAWRRARAARLRGPAPGQPQPRAGIGGRGERGLTVTLSLCTAPSAALSCTAPRRSISRWRSRPLRSAHAADGAARHDSDRARPRHSDALDRPRRRHAPGLGSIPSVAALRTGRLVAVGDGRQGRQLALLVPGWLHGCLGIHLAFAQRPLYRRLRWALLAAAVLLPVLGGLGFLAMGNELAAGLQRGRLDAAIRLADDRTAWLLGVRKCCSSSISAPSPRLRGAWNSGRARIATCGRPTQA